MADYKLFYYRNRVRTELIRLIFAAAGEQYEDIALDGGGQFPSNFRPPITSGTLPLLQFGDQYLTQSMAIARYLAEEFGLTSQNRFEQALIDSVVDAVSDVLVDANDLLNANNDDSRDFYQKRINERSLPELLRSLDTFHRQYSSGQSYIFGSNLSYADLAVYNMIDWFTNKGIVDHATFDSYDYTRNIRHVLEDTPRISNFLQTRHHAY